MSCKNKPKHTCGDRKSNARCVFYDIAVPTYSKLDEEDCLTVEETTEDLYKLVTWLRESVDLEGFEDGCLDVEKVSDSYKKNSTRYLVKDVLKQLQERVCSIEDSDGGDGTLELDFKCLVSQCGTQIGSLRDLLQVLIDEICALKG